MQFEKKTRAGKMSNIIKLLIKIVLIFLALLIVVILIDRIDFPSPIKKIEKIIPNENFKIVK
jgi:cell division septal protein FtsQ